MELTRITDEISILRIFNPAVEEGEHADFQGSGVLNHCADHIAVLKGFHGELTRWHMRDIASKLLDRGIEWLYIKRPNGNHKVPMATYISEGIWKGHWLMDLAVVRLALKTVSENIND